MSPDLGILARFSAALLGVITFASLITAPAAAADPPTRPATIVAMGDSLASGEGGGDYEPGGVPGQWCHRSANAQVQHAKPAGVDAVVNLACSGATTDSVRLGGGRHYGEAPQAEQLKTVARTHDIRSIVLTVGANDVPVVGVALECALRPVLPLPGCADRWNTKLPEKLKRIQPRITQNLRDIRTVMRQAGYADGSYDLILQSYVSPSSGESRYSTARGVLEGCPFRAKDTAWVRDAMFPMISRSMAEAASAVPGVRFLGLTGALDGRQVCAPGIDHDSELSWGLSLDPSGLRYGPGPNLVSQSLHPNAAGYRELARCLSAFHATPARSADCERTGDKVSLVTSSVTSP
ncbi:GDSL-type esterase/lipase family protein [Streptomyces gobiensis]|uniref:GDSL-type esterase/lipase family protein n=1 Tax=Streptomyces gobiensis TaxID=2875706 RepID=UPI001E453094|nr:GDSL-type esterase/lipase family protein [Streptomyces gobiensis]UGY91471.1 GDSL-type esterase/lipase family protein [Streptomyces gobiensis]